MYLKILLFIVYSCHCIATTASPRFTVEQGKIYDPNGIEFVAVGVNTFPDRNEDYADIVECWGFNTIRANNFPEPSWFWYGPTWEFDLLASTFADNGIVVILDIAHDSNQENAGIGRYWEGWSVQGVPAYSNLIDLYEFYARRYKDNPYVWIELVNEPGTTATMDSQRWVELHQSLILAVRGTGNLNPILVNGWCWGQDACGWGNSTVTEQHSAILGLGDQLLNINGVEIENIVFTHHVYDQFQYNSLERLTDYHDAVLAKGYALIVGEFGAININSTMKATGYMYESTQARGIGRIVWKWGGKSPNNLTTTGSGRNIDSCESPTNLTELGQLVWDDLRLYGLN